MVGFKKNLRHLLNRSDAKPKPTMTWCKTDHDVVTHVFLRLALVTCICFEFSLVHCVSFIVIGHCNCIDFGFGFTTLIVYFCVIQEVSDKGSKIAQLENEKSALIRDLFNNKASGKNGVSTKKSNKIF